MKFFNSGLFCGFALLLATAFSQQTTASEVYDIVLNGGRVMDPETGLDAVRNVGINGGTIEIISETPLQGHDVQDVSGLVIAPGFIDLHAHGQHTIGQQYQVRDGVTTALEMEGGVWPVDRFYALRAGKALINYGGTVSHICVRIKVKTGIDCPDLMAEEGATDPTADASEDDGQARTPFYEPASGEDMAAILAAINKGYELGGLGVGFGIEYTPGVGRKEVYEIFQQAADFKAPVFVHVRRRPVDVAPGIAIAVAQEIIANAAVTGAPLQLVHVTSTGLGDAPTIISMIEKAQERGLDITTEAYPYTAGSTSLGSALFDEGWREAFEADYGNLQWTETGERLTEETFLKYREEQPGGTVVLHVIPEEIARYAMAHPVVSIASDGMPWTTKGEHPRGAGTYGRVLGKYVRQEGALDLMLALRKTSLMPALRLEGFVPSMKHKGRIQVGADADITIFNPGTVIDNATFEQPMQYSTGFEHVLVDGTFVVRNANFVDGALPGKPILNGMVDSGQ